MKILLRRTLQRKKILLNAEASNLPEDDQMVNIDQYIEKNQ